MLTGLMGSSTGGSFTATTVTANCRVTGSAWLSSTCTVTVAFPTWFAVRVTTPLLVTLASTTAALLDSALCVSASPSGS